MAATDVKAGFGTLLKIGDGGGPEVFTTVPECQDFSGPASATQTEDATHMESPNQYEEHIAVMNSGGELSGTCNHLPGNAAQTLMRTAHETLTRRNFQLCYVSAGKRHEFAGYVTSWNPRTPVKGKRQIAWTIKITGKPALVAHP